MSKKRIIEGWGILKIKDIFDRVRNPVKVIADEEYNQIGIRSHGKGIFYKEAVTGEQLGWNVNTKLDKNYVGCSLNSIGVK